MHYARFACLSQWSQVTLCRSLAEGVPFPCLSGSLRNRVGKESTSTTNGIRSDDNHELCLSFEICLKTLRDIHRAFERPP